MEGNLVIRCSKKQSVVARSSVEAKFRAMTHSICEMLWLKSLLREMGYNLKGSIKLFYYNKVATSITHNSVQYDCTKHVKVGRHFAKEKLIEGLICTSFAMTKN